MRYLIIALVLGIGTARAESFKGHWTGAVNLTFVNCPFDPPIAVTENVDYIIKNRSGGRLTLVRATSQSVAKQSQDGSVTFKHALWYIDSAAGNCKSARTWKFSRVKNHRSTLSFSELITCANGAICQDKYRGKLTKANP